MKEPAMRRSAITALLLAAIGATPAMAQQVAQPDAFVRVGATHIDLVDKGRIFVGGVRDPGADYKTPKKIAASLDAGYFVLDNLAVQVSGTTPSTTYNLPAGSLRGVPNLGDDKFSIFTLTATYHPLRGRTVSPYIGAGVGLQKVWKLTDGVATGLDIRDAFGAVVHAGVEVNVNHRFALFADAKKAFWDANASGDLGPTHITAVAQLDPVLLTAGALFRF